MNDDGYLRAGVGLLIVGSDGRVLAAERADVPGAWQAPQGGIDDGETPLDAARRELSEELGVAWSQVTVVDEHPAWLGYELPGEARSAKTGRGQVHKWLLLRFDGDDADIKLPVGEGTEFRSWRWLTMAELIEMAWPVRQPVYRTLAQRWAAHLA